MLLLYKYVININVPCYKNIENDTNKSIFFLKVLYYL